MAINGDNCKVVEVSMVIDKKGNILTDSEFIKARIKNIEIDIDSTDKLIKHLDDLVRNWEGSNEYKKLEKNTVTF